MTSDGHEEGLCLGLTGGLACGKTTVGRIMEDSGFEILDADDLSHECISKGTEAYEAIIECFGEEVVGTDGEIDRAELGRKAFADPAALAQLSTIIHPVVREKWREWAEAKREAGIRSAVIIPLLFEVGETEGWDAVICVSASEDAVCSRLKSRGLDDEEIALRRASQWPVAKKAQLADYVIENDSSIEDLEIQTKNVLKQIVTKEK